MASDGMTFNSTTNFLNQNASLAASEMAIYSTSIVESMMIGCLKLFQLIKPSLYKNTQPNVDLLSSTSDMKSKSVYPFTFSLNPPPKIKNKFLILLKYLRMSNALYLDSNDICS